MFNWLKSKTPFFIFCLSLINLGLFYFYFIKSQEDLKRLKRELTSHRHEKISTQVQSPARIVFQKDGTTWLDVQRSVKDTVVQVFAHQLEKNIREPYRAPDQSRGVGTGFFINAEGDIISNYHVVAQSSNIQIQIPSCGHEQFEAEIRGVSPERDIALLTLKEDARKKILKRIKEIPFLELGDSDSVLRSQEVLALGYPLGQSRLKSTLGIVAGRERLGTFGYFQITAPLNPGNSGGPALNTKGEVIGINSRGIMEAQNVGYIIPINEVKSALKDLYDIKLLRKPILGCIFTVATDELISYLGNPGDGGWYIAQVFENTLLDEVGIKNEDMLYEINGHRIDKYGDLNVPWSEDKISLFELLNRLTIGDDIHLEIYRKGVRKEFEFQLQQKYLPPVRMIYPEFEPEALDYEIVGGMVVMNLSMNLIANLVQRSPDLVRYGKPEHQHVPALIITHIVPNSHAEKTRVIQSGDIIKEVNGQKVKTLNEFREAIMKNPQADYVKVKVDNELSAVFSVEKAIQEEKILCDRHFIPASPLIKELRQRRGDNEKQQ